VFPANSPNLNQHSHISLLSGGLQASQFFLLLLVLTAVAVSTDHLAAPPLRSSSPLWATAACLLLVWRRGHVGPDPENASARFSFTFGRLAGFLATHTGLILAARALHGTLQHAAGTVTPLGTLLAAGKLLVLAPSALLLPFAQWKRLLKIYRAETVAALVVLFTYFPGRAIEALWPWYGQVLGRFVYMLSSLFAQGIGYVGNLYPTLTGPDLNVTIILACSGMNGIELFDYLFGAMAILDWNRLQKGRALAGYFLGLLAMLVGNALRITSLVVLGNRGFAGTVAHYHISAGWIFFSLVFLLYLSMTYPWMVRKQKSPLEKAPVEMTTG
jgi:exosortase/archaeosortase family protein